MLIQSTMGKVVNWFKEESFRKLIRNSGTLLIGETGASIINIFSLIVLLKVLDAADYGILVLVQTYTITIDQLINFQSWQAFIKFGAEELATNNFKKFQNLIRQGTFIDFGTAVLGTVIAFLCVDSVGNFLGWNSEVILFSKIYSLSILFHFSGIPTGVLRIFNYYRIFSFQKIFVALIKLIGIIISYFLSYNLLTIIFIYLVADIIGHLFLTVFSYIVLWKKGLKNWWKGRTIFSKQFISFTVWTNLSTAITIPSKQLDVFIVSSALSIEIVGVYKVIKQVSSLLSRLVSPLYQSIYPEFATIIANKKFNKAIKTSIKVSIILAAIVAPIVLIISVTSPIWLNLFFGEIFRKSWVAFVVFFVYVGLDAISSPIHPLFNAFGYVKQKFLIMTVGNLMYLPIAWLLGHSYGLIGIVNAYGVQLMIITLSKIFYIKYKN